MTAQFDWDPDSYLELMHTEMPVYERLQAQAVAATGTGASGILELGTGTGETTLRLLERHPGCHVEGVDASDAMLARARERLPGDRVALRVGRLEDSLPPGPFDVVASVLAIHHLDAAGKADLFARVAAVLEPGGRFALGDVVVPERPEDATTPLDPAYDLPSSVAEQLVWLEDAGLAATVTWTHGDLAVISARRPA